MGLKYFMIAYMSVVHVAAAYGAYLVGSGAVSWATLAWALFFYWFSVTGIGVGAHRLYTHRAFQAAAPLRLFLVAACSVANEGSVLHWVRDHRVHHAHSETDADPHNARRGFWFAHAGWLFQDKRREVIEAGMRVGLKDVLSDPFVAFQERHKSWLMPVACFVLPASMVFWSGTDSYLTGLFVAGFLRYVIVLHVTWCINSVAHLYGDRRYDPKANPRENWFVSFFAQGEGYHSFHHKYPSNYRTSEFNILGGQLNLSTIFIDACAALGLVWDRKGYNQVLQRDEHGNLVIKSR